MANFLTNNGGRQYSDLMTEDRNPDITPLDHWLLVPARQISPESLPPLWDQTVIDVRCPRPPGVDARIELVHKIRGALGEQLRAGASPEARENQPCRWDPPCACDILWRERTVSGLTAGIPRPYALAADQNETTLLVRLSLFGRAQDRVHEAAESLVRGLRGGIDLNHQHRVFLDPTHRMIVREPGLSAAAPDWPAVAVEFLSPPVPRSQGRPADNPASFLRGLFTRIEGMSRWYGVELVGGKEWLRTCLASIHFDDHREDPIEHFRRSRHQGAPGITITGRSGSIVLSGGWQPLWPILAVGATIGGSRATHGYGRFRLVSAGA